ncbi:hypothetical protein MKW94_017433 [Papaver nudicaule]|uniref:Uncharacterized protein n=1 Tax=Papaver nudicaule TaxID=74823 RepID=A0AA42ASL0_PAPNU|nr:hypothetical protein [Papaver nudicaule]
MANRLGGFARMLSTAKNSTREEGLVGRMFSFTAGKNSVKNSKDAAPVALTVAERRKRMNREVDIAALKGMATGAAIVAGISHFAFGWNPFSKDLFGGRTTGARNSKAL